MRRLAAIAMIAFAASLSAFAAPAYAGHGHGSMMGQSMSMKHRCPPGQHWVKGYMKKNGMKVRGYCR